MKSYEVLEKAIPKGKSGKVAKILGFSADYVRRWRREAFSDDAPTATGQESILDRICDLIDAVFLVNPKGVALIVNYINAYYCNLLETHAKPLETHNCRAEHTAKLLIETTEAINKLNLEGCSKDTLKELIEMRDAADSTIKSVQRTLQIQEEE